MFGLGEQESAPMMWGAGGGHDCSKCGRRVEKVYGVEISDGGLEEKGPRVAEIIESLKDGACAECWDQGLAESKEIPVQLPVAHWPVHRHDHEG